MILWAPRTWHAVPRQTWISCRPGLKAEGPIERGDPINFVHRNAEPLPDMLQRLLGEVFLFRLNILKDGQDG